MLDGIDLSPLANGSAVVLGVIVILKLVHDIIQARGTVNVKAGESNPVPNLERISRVLEKIYAILEKLDERLDKIEPQIQKLYDLHDVYDSDDHMPVWWVRKALKDAISQLTEAVQGLNRLIVHTLGSRDDED